MGFDQGIERAKIEASSLSDAEIKAAEQHVRDMLRSKGRLVGTTSYLQREMQIGYPRATRIMKYLEAVGLVTVPNASGVRTPGPSWPE